MIIILKPVDHSAKDIINEYLKPQTYITCEYSFTTLFMWQHYYNTCYYQKENFLCLLGYQAGEYFSMLPLIKGDDYSYPIQCAKNFFKEKNQKVKFRGIPEDYLEKFRKYIDFPHEVTTNSSDYDYIYESDTFKYYQGKKLHKKRNNLNKFLKDYEGRFEYKKIVKEEYSQIYEFLEKWKLNKTMDDSLKNEEFGTKKLLCHYHDLDFSLAGVYIDGILEGFTIGNLLNKDYLIIQVEKANPEIRGLYQYLSQQFILQEFPDVKFINRQEDLGIPGLIKSKLSYRPCCYGVKYTITEVD